jgi:hypothetical protein
MTKYIRFGSSINAIGYDETEFDSAIETDEPLAAGEPVAGDHVTRLDDVGVTVGNVIADANLVDNAITRGDGGANKKIQTSGVIIDDSDNVSGINNSTVNGVRNQKYYCEAYSNTPRTIVIVTPNVWHPAFGLLQGECSDFIEDEGGLATIISIVQNGSDITIETDAPHGFEVGDPTSFVGGTGYDTQHMITAVADATHFDVTAAFIGDGTGFAIVGDNLTTPVDGIYLFHGFFSGNGLTGASTFEFDAIIDATLLDKGRPSRKFSNTTDRGNMAGSFFLDLTAGQKLSFAARNVGGTNNFTSSGTNINIHRI